MILKIGDKEIACVTSDAMDVTNTKSTFSQDITTGFIGDISKVEVVDGDTQFEVAFPEKTYRGGIDGLAPDWMKVGAHVEVCFILKTVRYIPITGKDVSGAVSVEYDYSKLQKP